MAVTHSNHVEREEAEEGNLSRRHCICGVILKHCVEPGQTEHINIRVMCIDSASAIAVILSPLCR